MNMALSTRKKGSCIWSRSRYAKKCLVVYLSVPFLPTLAIPSVQDLKGPFPRVAAKSGKNRTFQAWQLEMGNGKGKNKVIFNFKCILFGHLTLNGNDLILLSRGWISKHQHLTRCNLSSIIRNRLASFSSPFKRLTIFSHFSQEQQC